MPKLSPTQIFQAYFLYALLLIVASFVPFIEAKFLIISWLAGLMQINLVLKSVALDIPPVPVLGEMVSPSAYLRWLALLPIFAAFDEQTTLEVWQILLCYVILISIPMLLFAQQIHSLLQHELSYFRRPFLFRQQLIYMILATLAVVLGVMVFGLGGLRFIKGLKIAMMGIMLLGGLCAWSGILMWKQILIFRQPEKE